MLTCSSWCMCPVLTRQLKAAQVRYCFVSCPFLLLFNISSNLKPCLLHLRGKKLLNKAVKDVKVLDNSKSRMVPRQARTPESLRPHSSHRRRHGRRQC